MRRLFVLTLVLLAAAAVAMLAAFRSGRVEPRPMLLGALAGALMCGLLAELAWLALRVRARRGPRPVAAAGRAVLLAGLLAALAGGTVNWLLSLQGYVVLIEGETARLGAGGQLEGLEAGPLGDPRELEIDLALADVELIPAGGGSFDVVSLVETRRPGEPAERQSIGAGRVAEVGPIRLRQGAFGYAPRLVVLRDERAVFDRVVPFTTRRDGQRGTTFSGELRIAEEGLELSGEVRLDSLDEKLQGHPALRLSARRSAADLGAGELLPGQFAELAGGYRVGFAGLKKWSEVDVARRNYRAPMLAGLAAACAGALLWPLAAWRGW